MSVRRDLEICRYHRQGNVLADHLAHASMIRVDRLADPFPILSHKWRQNVSSEDSLIVPSQAYYLWLCIHVGSIFKLDSLPWLDIPCHFQKTSLIVTNIIRQFNLRNEEKGLVAYLNHLFETRVREK